MIPTPTIDVALRVDGGHMKPHELPAVWVLGADLTHDVAFVTVEEPDVVFVRSEINKNRCERVGSASGIHASARNPLRLVRCIARATTLPRKAQQGYFGSPKWDSSRHGTGTYNRLDLP
jgi:hypothetical protein